MVSMSTEEDIIHTGPKTILSNCRRLGSLLKFETGQFGQPVSGQGPVYFLRTKRPAIVAYLLGGIL